MFACTAVASSARVSRVFVVCVYDASCVRVFNVYDYVGAGACFIVTHFFVLFAPRHTFAEEDNCYVAATTNDCILITRCRVVCQRQSLINTTIARFQVHDYDERECVAQK